MKSIGLIHTAIARKDVVVAPRSALRPSPHEYKVITWLDAKRGQQLVLNVFILTPLEPTIHNYSINADHLLYSNFIRQECHHIKLITTKNAITGISD